MNPRKFGRRSIAAGLSVLVAWGTAVAVRAGEGAAPASRQDVAAAQDPRSADQLAKDVYEIFKRECFECHDAAKEGGLDLRTEDTLQKGGRNGKVVVPHKPGESSLYRP